MIKKYLVAFMMVVSNVINAQSEKNEDIITVFVHGTHRFYTGGQIPLVGPVLYHPEGLYRFDECYEKYVYKKFLAPLVKINKAENTINTVKNKIGTLQIEINNPENQISDSNFKVGDLYFFCWSARLDPEERLEAARCLHEALNKIIKQRGKKCKINILTHSHGGNVALNLVIFKQDAQYSIFNLILLAPPVQYITRNLVDDSLFENIYSFYSYDDKIQICDPQGLGQRRKIIRQVFTNCGQEQSDLKERIPLLSEYKFKSLKVKHIQIQDTLWWGHIDFLSERFFRNLGSILSKAEQHDFNAVPELVFNMKRNFSDVCKDFFKFIF